MRSKANCPLLLLLVFGLNSLTAGNDNLAGGARAAGMGDAGLCLEDVWCTRHNQAGLAFIKETELSSSFEIPFGLTALQTGGLACAIPLHKGAIGLDVSSFGSPDYQENKFGLAYALKIGSHCSAGVQLDYLRTVIAEGYGTRNAIAGELGLEALLFKNLKLGIHLNNPTRTSLAEYNDERYPTILRAGLLYRLSPKINLAVETEKDNFNPPIFRGGFEYTLVQSLIVRAGLNGNPTMFCFGAGFRMKNLIIDTAASWHPILGLSTGISIGYVFNPPT
jgi:hypothetical protein